MTDQDMELMEQWQAQTFIQTERAIHDLETCADMLTDFLKTREGLRAIRANDKHLKDALRKLHDLYLDSRPANLLQAG